MKKIWLTLLSLVVAILFQTTNVKATGNQVSFAKGQNDSVLVQVTLPEATSVHALKVTLKVDGNQTTAPNFVYTKSLQESSKIHEVRYNAKTKEVTLYLADLNEIDFSNGIDLGEFTDITTKTTFSNQTTVEIVDQTKQLLTLTTTASSLVVETESKDESINKPTEDVQKPADKPVSDETNEDETTDIDDKYQISDQEAKDEPKKDGVLGQTGAHKGVILTGVGTILVLTTVIGYLKVKR